MGRIFQQNLDNSKRNGHVTLIWNSRDPLLSSIVRADTKLEVSVTEHPGPWNYFMDAPVLTTATYPDDLDTTSYALTLDLGKENADTVMNEMLKHINTQDIIQVHFDHDRNYIDPVVCITFSASFRSTDVGTSLRIRSAMFFLCSRATNTRQAHATILLRTHSCTFYPAFLLSPSSTAPKEIQSWRISSWPSSQSL
jgi:hypothetical protein